MARRKGAQTIAGKLLHFGLHQVIGDHDPYYTVSLTLEAQDGSKTEVVLDLGGAAWLSKGLGEYVYKATVENARLEDARQDAAERETQRPTFLDEVIAMQDAEDREW